MRGLRTLRMIDDCITFMPKVYNKIILVDRAPFKILYETENIRVPPEIGSSLENYTVVDYEYARTFAPYSFYLTIYVVNPNNWTPTPDNWEYFGYYTQKEIIVCKKVERKVWVEREFDRGYIPEKIYL